MANEPLECSHLMQSRAGCMLPGNCRNKVAYVDPLGRGWCKRHEPDAETKERWEGIANMQRPKASEVESAMEPFHEAWRDSLYVISFPNTYRRGHRSRSVAGTLHLSTCSLLNAERRAHTSYPSMVYATTLEEFVESSHENLSAPLHICRRCLPGLDLSGPMIRER